MTFLFDFGNEFISGGQFNWWVLFEGELMFDLFFLHVNAMNEEFFYKFELKHASYIY